MNWTRMQVRRIMRGIARLLDRFTGGKLTPNAITIVGAVAHIPIASLIAIHEFWWAAGLLIIFGLFDTLDGELARLQKKASPAGMLLDASTDRFKEVLLYTGAGYSLAMSSHPAFSAIAVMACGASICVSYVKAKGESAMITGQKDIPHATLNRLFSDGLATFEVRMLLLVLGLLFNQLAISLGVIAVLASYTALKRLYTISRELKPWSK